MPSELRYILFRPTEVVEAVKEFHLRRGTPFPAGCIVECGPECDENLDGTVRFRITLNSAEGATPDAPPADGLLEQVVIGGEALAVALILYCRDRNIPIPAKAGKSLQCRGRDVCLLTTIN